MARRIDTALMRCVQLLLRPAVKFCLSRSLGLQDLVECSKTVFLDIAAQEIGKQGKKINMSRLSIVTGVHRRDVVRIFREDDVKEGSSHFASRVISQWRNDPRFQTAAGRPKVLTFKGDDSEFRTLVRMVSRETKAGTVLFELERVGAVERIDDGIRLVAKAYMSKDDPIEEYQMLAEDAEEFVDAVMANIGNDTTVRPNFHAKTMFDNVSKEDLPKIRNWLLKQCSQFHRKVEKFLSKHDLDINPDSEKTGGERVAFVSFSQTIK